MSAQLLFLLLSLCIFHGSAGSSIYLSETTFSSVPSERVSGFARHLLSLSDNTQIASPLSDGFVVDSPLESPPSKTAPAPRAIEVPITSMPTNNSAPLSQTVPEQVPPMTQIVAPESAPYIHPHITAPPVQVPIVSPPSYIPEKPLPELPRPEIAPTISGMPNVSASPPRGIPEKSLPVPPSKSRMAPTISDAVPPMSNSPPSTSGNKYAIPAAAPPKEMSKPWSPVNHPPEKENTVSPIASPPKMSTEKPVAVHPSKPGIAPSMPPEHPVSPIFTPPPRTTRKDYGIPIAAPPRETFDHPVHPPVKEHTVSPISTPPSTGKKDGMQIAPPKADSHQLPPPSHSPIKEHAAPPKSTPPPSINKKERGAPVAAPRKQKFDKLSPTTHSPTKGIPVAPHSPVPTKSPVISFAPLHSPTVAPKKSGLRHHHTPPLIHGKISPINPPSTVTRDSPAPSPSPTIASAQAKRPVLRPLNSPPKAAPPPPVQVLPPPPPNRDCTSFTCSEPYTNTPPGAPCDCVFPIKVELRLGVALYTFFPLVSELATEIASGVFLKQSQVRIMGANAATQQLDKTDVLIDLVPLGEKFDNTTAFLTYEKFWHKQVAIKTSFFGDYEVLYVSYPGLPPSPPTSVIDGVPYTDPTNNARTIHPLGVDVRRRHHRGLGGGIISIIVLSSFVAAIVCIGSAWLLLLRCGDRTHPVAKTPRTSIPSLTKQSGAAGSTMFGSGISSTSLSFGSSMTAYTGTAKTFSADEIERATDNFDNSRILGEGGFGRVYKGILEDGKEVAVKVLKRDDQQGGREFLAEVEMLSRLHHRNLVKLIGICVEDHSHSLVYELIPNGSVESHLHGVDKETAPLDWGARMKIALGAARGLAYLHEDSSPHVIHRDFKSSNILLEDDFTPKVADFGLARTALDEGNKHISTRVMGTFGYVAPEYAMTGHLLVKSDVYSYGVVLLELLSGRKPVDMSQPEGQENLVAWARPLLTSKEGLEMIIDPTLGSNFPFDSIAKVAAIASMCVQPEVSHRPFMGEVVQALKLVCDECDVSKEAGSETCSQDYTSVIDIDARTSTGSGNLLETSQTHAHYSEYDSTPEADRVLSASDIFTTPRRFGRQSPGSFRRHSSSGPLRPGRSRQFWQRVRSLSRGSISEHAFAYRMWGESH